MNYVTSTTKQTHVFRSLRVTPEKLFILPESVTIDGAELFHTISVELSAYGPSGA